MASIVREPIVQEDPNPDGDVLHCFDTDHSIEDIVRYAVKCLNGSTADVRSICDWIDKEDV